MAFDATFLDSLRHRDEIGVADVIALRMPSDGRGPVTSEHISGLLAIKRAVCRKAPLWRGLLIDAMMLHALHDTAPDGYLDVAKADRLLALAAPGGLAPTPDTFAALTAVLDAARWAPERFSIALLAQIAREVEAVGFVGAGDTSRVRRILYAAAKGAVQAITRREVEALLAIDRAGPRHQDASWLVLASRALADAALGASGLASPVREVVLAPVGLVRAGGRASAIAARYRSMSIEEREIARLERQRVAVITGEHPAPIEARDLVAMLAKHPATPTVATLRAHLTDLGASLHPEISRWVGASLVAVPDGAAAAA
jgi:hypothetical protein